jgi:hypothetical protein
MVKRKLIHGDSIPGSALYRAFCHYCGDPIRVNASDLAGKNCCHRCDSEESMPLPATADDANPWQENAIRAMEDRDGGLS